MEFKAIDKYEHMIRAFEKLEKIAINNGNVISNIEAKDSAEDFFNQCYHFKDWLKKELTLKSIFDVEKFISSDEFLSIAADYCNLFKHSELTKSPRTGNQIEKINTHINMSITPSGVVTNSQLKIVIGGKGYDSYSLAKNCVNSWKRYLVSKNVNFNG
jgi:hypothetical protein